MKDIPSPGIELFQGELGYEPALLSVTGYNVFLLLAHNAGSNVQDYTATGDLQQDHLPDADGKFTPAAYDWASLPGHTEAETGSGVLARITFKASATASGISPLTLKNVKLGDPALPPNYFGDTNGDDFFDGSISNAEIRIGEPCPTATATPTPTRTPTATATGVAQPVGGTAELPDHQGGSVAGSSVPIAGYIGLAAVLVAAAGAVIAAGAWCVRARSRRDS